MNATVLYVVNLLSRTRQAACLMHECRAASTALTLGSLISIGESPDRPARQAGSMLSLTELRRMPSGRPAGMHLINPEEITLGALVGEGGFGKVRQFSPSILQPDGQQSPK